MKRKIIPALGAALGMMLLILDGKTAFRGASEGIDLCIRSVIPSLFPFLVLTALLTGSLSGVRFPLLRPLCRLVGIPKGGESLLLAGILGGYPSGAQAVAQLYRLGQISRENASRLLMFCSNAGPSFLFGIVAARFSSPLAAWALLGVGILSAMLVGLLVPNKKSEVVEPAERCIPFPEIVGHSGKVMAQICAWVVLFRILTAFLQRWCLWLLPQEFQCLVTGLLELTDGCCSLDRVADEGLRFLLAAIMLNFGGLCVWLQTTSVVGDLGTASYLKGKLLQTLISGLLAWAVLTKAYWGVMLPVVLGVIFRELKKRGRNRAPLGV